MLALALTLLLQQWLVLLLQLWLALLLQQWRSAPIGVTHTLIAQHVIAQREARSTCARQFGDR